MKNKLINQCIELYKKSLDESSRFYRTDLESFERVIKTKSLEELNRIHNNLSFHNSKTLEKQVNKEVNKMDKADLFNPNSLTGKDALR